MLVTHCSVQGRHIVAFPLHGMQGKAEAIGYWLIFIIGLLHNLAGKGRGFKLLMISGILEQLVYLGVCFFCSNSFDQELGHL